MSKSFHRLNLLHTISSSSGCWFKMHLPESEMKRKTLHVTHLSTETACGLISCRMTFQTCPPELHYVKKFVKRFWSWQNYAWNSYELIRFISQIRKSGSAGEEHQHTSFPVVVDGARLCCQFVPAFELQILVLQPDLGKGLIDVHRRLSGTVTWWVLLTPAALVQGTCMWDRERQMNEDTKVLKKCQTPWKLVMKSFSTVSKKSGSSTVFARGGTSVQVMSSDLNIEFAVLTKT